MGYRSQVVLAVSKEAVPQFMSTMAKSPEARSLCFSEADRVEQDYDGEGGMLFYWDHIKWYDSYEPIRAIENFMDWAEGAGQDDEFKFARTGENMEDNECRGCGFDVIYISRSIEF